MDKQASGMELINRGIRTLAEHHLHSINVDDETKEAFMIDLSDAITSGLNECGDSLSKEIVFLFLMNMWREEQFPKGWKK